MAISRHSRTVSITAVALAAAGTAWLALVPLAAVAQQQITPQGSWSGGGNVTFPSGSSERARCRASFSRASANSFRMSAICATSSARVAQTGMVERVSANQFSGTFFNSEYNVSGNISLVIRGNSMSAQLSGGGASANLTFGR